MNRWPSHLVLLGLIAASVSAAAPINVERYPLVGLKEIAVAIEAIPAVLEKSIDRKQLQASVELRLRRAGIKVVELDGKAGVPYLYVNLNAIRHQNLPVIACAIEVRCNEKAMLVRDPSIATFFSTWHNGTIATVGEANARQLEDSVLGIVDVFANDLLAANQK